MNANAREDQESPNINLDSEKRVRFLNETRVQQLKSQCCSNCVVYHAKKQDKKIVKVKPPQQTCSGNVCRSPDKNFTQTLEFSYAEISQLEDSWEEISGNEKFEVEPVDSETFIEQGELYSRPSEVVILNLNVLSKPKNSEHFVEKDSRINGAIDLFSRNLTQNAGLEPRSHSLDSRSSSDPNSPNTYGVHRLSRKKQLPNRLRQDNFSTENFPNVNQTEFSQVSNKQTSSKLGWDPPLKIEHDLSPIRKMEQKENKDRNLYRCSELFLSLPGLKNGYKEMEIRKKIYRQLNNNITSQDQRFDWSNEISSTSQASSTNDSQASTSSSCEADFNFGQCRNCSENSKHLCQRKWCFSTKVNYPIICDPERLIKLD